MAKVAEGVRPDLPGGVAPPAGYAALMQRCWAAEWRERPLFAEIVPELEGIDPETGGEDRESVASSSEASQTRSL